MCTGAPGDTRPPAAGGTQGERTLASESERGSKLTCHLQGVSVLGYLGGAVHPRELKARSQAPPAVSPRTVRQGVDVGRWASAPRSSRLLSQPGARSSAGRSQQWGRTGTLTPSGIPAPVCGCCAPCLAGWTSVIQTQLADTPGPALRPGHAVLSPRCPAPAPPRGGGC